MAAAKKKDDPTVSSDAVDSTEYPEGTHPARSASEVTDSAENIKYADMPDSDKPDPSTVAQVEVRNDDSGS
jgi:hypothetical protein